MDPKESIAKWSIRAQEAQSEGDKSAYNEAMYMIYLIRQADKKSLSVPTLTGD